MMLGCTSDAGKSFLVTGICRALANRGFSVAPFKAQNMSNNAAVTPDGLEIGRAQYAQALAARVVPSVRMNPVLLKPMSDTRGAVILNGRPAPEVEAMAWTQRPSVTWPVVEGAVRSLMDDYDIVVIEGAGSPAEINLRHSDIVNMRVAKAVQAHSYLCSDIDRGGSFAHLLGTWHCLEPDERELLKGFVLNRFRGDPTLLGDATGWLEAQTGVPTVAVVPWIHHQLPEEDRLIVRNADDDSDPNSSVRIGIVLYPFASNTDEFDVLGTIPGVSVSTVREAEDLDRFDALILPGSRNVAVSAGWLGSTGLGRRIRDRVTGGAHVLGICGGMQILGSAIRDPLGLEGGAVAGLELLDVATEFAADKVTQPFAGVLIPTGRLVRGYEIHHGRTVSQQDGRAVALFDSDVGWQQDRVVGVYAHALLEDDGFRQWWLGRLGISPENAVAGRESSLWAATLDEEFDRVAAHIETTGLVESIVGELRA